MTPSGYITGILLIAVVVLQMRVRTLTLRSLLLPLGLVAGAGSGSGLAEGPAVSLRRGPAHAGEVPAQHQRARRRRRS